MLSLYLRQVRTYPCNIDGNLPHKVNGFDDEAQGWADRSDILVHDPFDDCRLARIVKTPTNVSSLSMLDQGPYSINIRISLSFKRALRSIDNMVEMCERKDGGPQVSTSVVGFTGFFIFFIFLSPLDCYHVFCF
jgi:hypothetical protein